MTKKEKELRIWYLQRAIYLLYSFLEGNIRNYPKDYEIFSNLRKKLIKELAELQDC